MDQIQFIVARLNDPPFRRKLSLVDFDDKSPGELLQLMIDVFAVLDEAMACDVREVDREALLHKALTFLNILKFVLPDDEAERDGFARGLTEGSKNAVYPVLHWVLQRLPSLQKRAYLAKYLVPEPIPQEFMQDEVLVEIHASHKELQAQFKEVHKVIDKLRADPSRPKEIKGEIATLEDERKQLAAKIERLKTQTKDEAGFPPLLAATSALRQQQDEDGRLNENRRRQLMTLQHARQRHEEAARRLQQLKRNQSGSASAEEMLAQLEAECAELTQRVQGVMPREIEQQSERLKALQELMFEPQRTRDDVQSMGEEVDQLETRCKQLKAAVDAEVSGRLDNKLAMFRQTALVAAKKLAAKEEELEREEALLKRAQKEAEEKEQALSEAAGPKFMTRDEFKQYGNQLREKTHVYKKQKAELAERRAEAVRLGRTEQILRGRDRNLSDFLSVLEAKRGVAGYRDVAARLQSASELAMGVDVNKEQTLESISAMVKAMSDALKAKKAVLAPEIKKLREMRKLYADVDHEYAAKKTVYDKVAVGLEVERQGIESEADRCQAEALQEESNFHYFEHLTGIAKQALARVRNEDEWASGRGHLLPSFRTYADLYKDKEARQKALKEQLEKQKASLSTSESGSMEQRRLFADLGKLLAAKVRSASRAATGGGGFGSSEFDMGGAKVMRLGD